MAELMKGDFMLHTGRRCVILESRTEAETVIGLEDTTEETVPRGELQAATNAEIDASQREALALTHQASLAPPAVPQELDEVILPDGTTGTVVRLVGRAGVVVLLADDSEVQMHRNSLRSP